MRMARHCETAASRQLSRYNDFASYTCLILSAEAASHGASGEITPRRSMRPPSNTVTAIALFCAFAPAVSAQDGATEPPAHVAVVDGAATLDREDLVEPAAAGMPLVPGDRLRTERGRVEILFPDGSALAVDEYSLIELQAPSFRSRSPVDARFWWSPAPADPESAGRFQVDTPAASVNTYGPGEYRISVSGPDGGQTELAVVRGSASLVTDGGSTPLRAGERSVASTGALRFSPQYFNSARFDAFDRWAAAAPRRTRVDRPPPGTCLPISACTADARSVRRVGARFAVRLRLVSERRGGLASVLRRVLVVGSRLRMDLGWPRRVGLADTPLRSMGIRRATGGSGFRTGTGRPRGSRGAALPAT